jgi:PAS domain S-box-containing protein
MMKEEETLLQLRMMDRARWSNWSQRGFLTVSVAGALLLLVFAWIVTRDFRRRRHMLSQLRAAEERSRLLVDGVRDYAIVRLDPDGKVATWGSGAERLLGYSADEIVGHHFSIFYPPEDVRDGKCAHELEDARRDGRREDEGWRVRKNGTRFWANTVVTAIQDSQGTLLGYAKVTRDLTEQIRSEELRTRLTQANEAVRLRDEFLSIASHELRTPLTPLSLLLQRMERTLAQGDRVDSATVRRADRQVQRLLRLINELLDLSRLQAGKLQLERVETELGSLVKTVVEDFSGLGSGHGFELDLPQPVSVRGDRDRLEQVLVNLVQNAIKYSPRGGVVKISVGVVAREAKVTVEDTGIGIPEDEQPQIFKRFFRARNAETKHFGGLGLGLFLSHEIVQRHGGRFEVQSAPGKGSSFSFFIPGVVEATTGDPVARRVLLVDDDPAILETVGEALRDAGYQVDTASSGLDALQTLQTRQPDILLVDLMMPLLDGASLIERIRDERLVTEAPIVVFSADHRVKERAFAVQADAALSKPIDLAVLESAMLRLLGSPATTARS